MHSSKIRIFCLFLIWYILDKNFNQKCAEILYVLRIFINISKLIHQVRNEILLLFAHSWHELTHNVNIISLSDRKMHRKCLMLKVWFDRKESKLRFMYLLSLLDNAPNKLVGRVIQKRYRYVSIVSIVAGIILWLIFWILRFNALESFSKINSKVCFLFLSSHYVLPNWKTESGFFYCNLNLAN